MELTMREARLPYVLRFNPIFIILGMLFIIIIPFLIWSNIVILEQRSSAHGQVIVTTKTQKIQSAIDGVIDNIKISEGDIVKKGDLIISLEKEQNKASMDAIKAKVASLKIKYHRLKAEVYGGKLNFRNDFVEPQYKEFTKTQLKLFSLRKKALNDEITALKGSLKLKEEELKINKPLVKTGDIGRMKLINIERDITDLKGKISNVKNKYFQASQEEMTKVEEELSINEEMLVEKSVNLQRSDIYAQMDAIVKEIQITTKGAKVRPGDVILEMVPLDDDLIIEAKLTPADISFIKVGQKAHVKFDTYDFSIFGMFDGEVIFISPDSIVENTNRGEEFFFKVQIKLDKKELKTKSGQILNITPGMGAQVDIITGERTVFSYLTKPIIKTLDESFKER
jgi:multidrug efflux pump subunit AcrA (membrane-fusion protein)